MASLQTSSLILSSSSSSTSFSSNRINAALQLPDLPRDRFTVLQNRTRKMVEGLNLKVDRFPNTFPVLENNNNNVSTTTPPDSAATSKFTEQFYAILEAVADRVEMHNNIGVQRNNWNTLLLNSINMITLTASTMAGVAAATSGGGAGMSLLALKLSSTLLFSAAAGMLLVMNKIQPSQLAEEQRNAARLFKQLQNQFQTVVSLRAPTEQDVKDAMEKVLALDKAYPLPLLGAMIEKFPEKFEHAVWWPSSKSKSRSNLYSSTTTAKKNGWSEELEAEMREIVQVVKGKDREDYERLGNIALKINKSLAIAGPLLTGIAALSSPFIGNGSLGAVVAVTTGALASAVNSFEHGGQVGMVIEMYRNCAGFFKLMEDSIEATLEESDVEKRENGELFQMKVALQLGRSLPQLNHIAAKSAASRMEGIAVDEFASRLF
ncbi:probable F-box protein At4g22030 [Ziziphus jujuba]|uniref:Probable F-box protein At4g22030 n=1 Tax=Ziziphus jujuba TaxID=326968 RepID=A0ABM3I8J0_ZIZJJ|nr:probable F-box protein At4g22030 [Ziziphus jujuba]